jgi:uncharacterized membrane protein
MTKKKILERISSSLRQFLFSTIKFFFYGVITLIPIFLILWLLNFFSGTEAINPRIVLRMALEKIFPKAVIDNWVVGITLFLIIIAIGALSPLVTKNIHSWIKKLMDNLLKGKIGGKHQGLVACEFRKGIWILGIITGYIKGSENLEGGKILKIFVPSVPIPITGFSPILIQEKDVIRISATFDEIINIYTSGGILAPERIPELVAELKKRKEVL